MTSLHWFAFILLGLCAAILFAILDAWRVSRKQDRLAKKYRDEAARFRHPMPYEGE